MLRYFVATNLWALMAIALVVGRKPWRASPTRYECFGRGSLDPASYGLLIALCLTAAGVFFPLTWKTRAKKLP